MIRPLTRALTSAVRSLVRQHGFDVVRYREPDTSDALRKALHVLTELRRFGGDDSFREETDFLRFCAMHYTNSKAQIFQDLFVQYVLAEKRDGFFVEFGATNGVGRSNTHLLEKHYGWGGILSEPARTWHEALKRNRNCTIETRCVWDETGNELEFNETSDPELSTIDTFSSKDFHASSRKSGERYNVKTVSLNDLLAEHHAPHVIDYLSVDTEGSELKILSAFDFTRHRIKVITVEHNNTRAREGLHALLTTNGFERKLENLSQWDDWYVASNL
ncbi:MAG: FkbM family methyltransferase [Clostridia bacterium]|nr:FkbM family methyltransferase [Deltaproteobacteria bacterium]